MPTVPVKKGDTAETVNAWSGFVVIDLWALFFKGREFVVALSGVCGWAMNGKARGDFGCFFRFLASNAAGSREERRLGGDRKTLRVTPAMEAKLTTKPMTIEDIVIIAYADELQQKTSEKKE